MELLMTIALLGLAGFAVAVLLGVVRLTPSGLDRAVVYRPPLPWYEPTGSMVAIRTYPSADRATADANRAAPFGWTVQSVTTSDGHVNVGRTVTGAVFTGGISLLLGGSRTKGSVTVTFVRTAAASSESPAAV